MFPHALLCGCDPPLCRTYWIRHLWHSTLAVTAVTACCARASASFATSPSQKTRCARGWAAGACPTTHPLCAAASCRQQGAAAATQQKCSWLLSSRSSTSQHSSCKEEEQQQTMASRGNARGSSSPPPPARLCAAQGHPMPAPPQQQQQQEHHTCRMMQPYSRSRTLQLMPSRSSSNSRRCNKMPPHTCAARACCLGARRGAGSQRMPRLRTPPQHS